MDRADIAKVLVFDDEMEHVLLLRDETLSAFSGVIESLSIFQGVREIMKEHLYMEIRSQPHWWHIRTEVFTSANRHVHIFFGKISRVEFAMAEDRNRMSIGVPVRSLPKTISPRLTYLIPMAMVLSSMDSRFWPKA